MRVQQVGDRGLELRAPLAQRLATGALSLLAGAAVGLWPLYVAPTDCLAAPANAPRQNAPTGTGSRVNKDAESLLRNGLPISCPEVRKLQSAIEQSKNDLRVKRIGAAVSDLQQARMLIQSKGAAMLKAVRASEADAGKRVLGEIDASVDAALAAVNEMGGQGSVQERNALDKCAQAQTQAAAKLSELEELMVPEGFKVEIPAEYRGLPVLQGRAKVKFTFKKPEGEQFDVAGKLSETAELIMVVDGYTAPITSGNFLDLVDKGFYDGMTIQRSDGFVVQTGKPKDAEGYIPPGSKTARRIPLEISVVGDKGPMWGSTTEEDMRGAAATKLPFSAYGALGMARTEFEDDSASSQFFWLLFDSDLTPAGKNLLDGSYANFGFTVENAEYLSDIKEGDIITSAKIIEGADRLQRE